VDFADFISVLANGGEARVIQASGATASTAFDHLLAKEEFPEWISDTKAAVSLHIRANPVLSMNEFDEIGRLLESQVTEDSLVVMSIGVWNGRGIELTLLSVSARR
jgi:cell division GTPase FtsZ